VQFKKPPTVNNHEKYDNCLLKFISHCLVKDVRIRPDIETLVNSHKEFFSYAKDPHYLKTMFIKTLPNIVERVNNLINFKIVWKNSF